MGLLALYRFVMMLSEDFFFAELTQSFALQPNRRNNALFRVSFCGFSLDAFPTDPLRQEASLDTRRETAVSDFTVVLGPSTPDAVASVHRRVLTTPEQITICRAEF